MNTDEQSNEFSAGEATAREITDRRAGNSTISNKELVAWKNSEHVEVRTEAFLILWKWFIEHSRVHEHEVDWMIAFLMDRIFANEKGSEFKFSGWEAAEYLAVMFEVWWRAEPRATDDLLEMRSHFEALVRAGGYQREILLLRILEHLLGDEKVAEFFADWRNDPKLGATLEDALELARGFEKT